MQLEPWYIVPLLVGQPTWGGEYIVGFKGISEPSLLHKKIGQSFELSVETIVSTQPAEDLPFLAAEATSLDSTNYFGTPTETTSLQKLIDQDPAGVLGSQVVAKTGPKLNLLIKFTQAQNNSYQLHIPVGQTLGNWIPKPESWYYFERGKATMGLAPGANVHEYQQRCEAIYAYSQEVSDRIKKGTFTIEEGRARVLEFIAQDHPQRFVNTIFVETDQILDLSEGGIHHSWETDPSLPNGNIVFEVQLDAKDDLATIRSFDQGNIKDDGSVRPLAIADYFTVLNTDPEFNQPARFQRTSQTVTDQGVEVTTLFDNEYYLTKKLVVSGGYRGTETETKDKYHHLFVKEGTISVQTQEKKYSLKKGWSLFIPAGVPHYSIESQGTAEVLKTTVA